MSGRWGYACAVNPLLRCGHVVRVEDGCGTPEEAVASAFWRGDIVRLSAAPSSEVQPRVDLSRLKEYGIDFRVRGGGVRLLRSPVHSPDELSTQVDTQDLTPYLGVSPGFQAGA